MAFANWISRAVRQGGEYNSANYTIPTGIDEIRVKLNLLGNDDFAEGSSITIRVERSADGAQTWEEYFTIGWLGGAVPTGPGGPIGWVGGVSGIGEHAGELARVHVSSSGNFRWGIQVEIR